MGGVRGFFKGSASPVLAVIPSNATVFGAYEFSKRQMGVTCEADYTFKQSLLAGLFASTINTPVVCVTELVKCRMQCTETEFSSSLQCFLHIWKNEGSTALFQGMTVTASREVPAYVAYFTSFYLAKRAWTKGGNIEDIT